jgi:penicillin-binding protein 1A
MRVGFQLWRSSRDTRGMGLRLPQEFECHPQGEFLNFVTLGRFMESLLVKIFAMALAISQVTTASDAVRTRFDRTQDQEQVTRLLRDGCTHIKKVFDIEHINLDDLITIALDDSQAITQKSKAFRGINFVDLQTAYRRFCTDQKVVAPALDLGDVIDSYNKATAELPDHSKLKGTTLPGTSALLDGASRAFAEVSARGRRRKWVPLADIPKHVQSAFIAAEDRNFYEHKGIDERGLIRAFVSNLAGNGRLQGGSTITQQVVKNLLVGSDRTYKRKIREIILTARVEQTLSKAEILELYLNAIYFGRASWGIEMAARAYFNKTAKELTLKEGALLAGLVKGPNYFSPDRHPRRAQKRLAYVLKRLEDDRLLPIAQSGRGLPTLPRLVAYQRSRRDIGYYFVDQVVREAKSAGIETLSTGAYTVRTTINQKLQTAVEEALQEGLSRYERNSGRAQFKAPEANLAKAIERSEADQNVDDDRPAWQRVLADLRLPLYDVHWEPAVVLDNTGGKHGETWRVGLTDGRVLPLGIDATTKHKLALYDVVLVRVIESKGRRWARAELRVRPTVQGAAVVLENKTGRILAMTGGFSYPLSQLNRVTQAARQPGSTIKPLSYLAALGRGVQPNTLVMDEPITLPPLGRKRASAGDYWTPKNYDGRSRGVLTLRSALENSRNLATVHLLTGGIDKTPEDSLTRLCDLAVEAQIYRECARFYPFALGAQPVRPIDLAAFYAAIANEGLRPAPYVVESIERDGETLYRHRQTATPVNSVDQAAFYQLKTMLQGVIARGTASAISDLAPYVAGKTGTSDDENDAWFVGLTKDVTVAVWIGYDNAEGKRRTLGGGSTGGAVAVPIFEPIINAVWSNAAPRTVLAPPSPEAKRRLACKSIGRGQAFSECFRVNAKGKVIDTENVLLSGKGSESDRLLKNYARLEAGAADSKEEADDSERSTGVKAQADPDDEPEVRHTRRAKRARAQSDDARKDRKARSSKYGRTKTKRDGDQVNSARADRASPSARSASSWNDPWRSQWNWQGQYGRSQWNWQGIYGQTSSWGRWR